MTEDCMRKLKTLKKQIIKNYIRFTITSFFFILMLFTLKYTKKKVIASVILYSRNISSAQKNFPQTET